jgi:hypothetical protein
VTILMFGRADFHFWAGLFHWNISYDVMQELEEENILAINFNDLFLFFHLLFSILSDFYQKKWSKGNLVHFL